MKKKSSGALVLVLVVSLGCFLYGRPAVQALAEEGSIIEELKLFSKSMGAILEAYVEDREPRKLFYDAVKGMMSSLDPYCEFINKQDYELLKISMKGEYSGIGAKIELVDSFPAIAEIQPDSAAEKAGLQVKDSIRKINGEDMKDKPIPDVAALLRGEENTGLTLTIFRIATGKLLDVAIVREKVEIPVVKDVRIIGRALGYLHILEFSEGTNDQVARALTELRGKGMQALIIDLRGNVGGVMPQAIELAEKFIPEGKKIISVSSKLEVQRKEYVSTNKQIEPDYPIVIIVNEASASASEIFTVAMKDNGRAKVIGAKTFGKASVQSVVPLDDVTAMKITTARYVSPNGTVIDKVGIQPDEVVTNGPPGTPGYDVQTERALELMRNYIQ